MLRSHISGSWHRGVRSKVAVPAALDSNSTAYIGVLTQECALFLGTKIFTVGATV
ncbi:unnamed protein product [Ectocarpus sp. CCAP 1310/34]|nr:unnamed protein product [Ectocarpus sp. CCAP 1310/34]